MMSKFEELSDNASDDTQSTQSETKTVETSPSEEYEVIKIKKGKKNEPKFFPKLLSVDKNAFGGDGPLENHTAILRILWRSRSNEIIVARKKKTQAIVGYACYMKQDHGVHYLMRIAVRQNCQRKGLGKLLINELKNISENKLSLEVTTDNDKAINFYIRIGLIQTELYETQEGIEFSKFMSEEALEAASLAN